MADANQALKLNPDDSVALALRAASHVAKGDARHRRPAGGEDRSRCGAEGVGVLM